MLQKKWKVSVSFWGVLAASGALACEGQLGGVASGDAAEVTPGEKSGPGSELGDLSDPGFKGIHRLNGREYNNTLRDLLGTQLRPADTFLNVAGHGFDNDAETLGMTSAQYSGYFQAAEEVAADVFADTSQRDRFMICDTGAPDLQCAEQIITAWGPVAFRRTLFDHEAEVFLGVYVRAVELGLDHLQASEQVLRAFLSSAEFLYRMEFDAAPDSDDVHPVSQAELASRLSYFLWSSAPDAQLRSLADAGELNGDRLAEEVERMLADPKAEALIDSLAWQWLGMKKLESHGVLSDAFPEWSEELRAAMLTEAREYLRGYIQGELPWSEFLVGSFESPEALSSFYGESEGQRFGFLGLGAFLTVSSFAHRTSPTFRAKWILEELLCDPPLPPPANADIPDLEAGTGVDPNDLANQAALIENVRERLELHRSDPGCAGCHAAMDPLGMALENFDGVGRYREAYTNGDPVDPTGEMPDGTPFDGLPSLANALSEDERFSACAVEKTFTYALGRVAKKNDDAHLAAIGAEWQGEEDATFQELVKKMINSVPFQMRRGGSK